MDLIATGNATLFTDSSSSSKTFEDYLTRFNIDAAEQIFPLRVTGLPVETGCNETKTKAPINPALYAGKSSAHAESPWISSLGNRNLAPESLSVSTNFLLSKFCNTISHYFVG